MRWPSCSPAFGRFGEPLRCESSHLGVDLANEIVDRADRLIPYVPHFLGRPLQQLAPFQDLERKVADRLVDLLDRSGSLVNRILNQLWSWRDPPGKLEQQWACRGHAIHALTMVVRGECAVGNQSAAVFAHARRAKPAGVRTRERLLNEEQERLAASKARCERGRRRASASRVSHRVRDRSSPILGPRVTSA